MALLFSGASYKESKMNVKATVNIMIEKNERTYVFSMPVGAPFGEAYDAAFEALTQISNMAKEAIESARNKESKSVEEIPN
jgi:hypothetical protein